MSEAPSIDGDLLDRLHLELADHRGADAAITSDELATRVGIDERQGTNPKLRKAVRVLMRERRVPVVSSHAGYYVPESRDEIDDYLENLEGRIEGIRQRKRLVETAADARLATDGGREQIGGHADRYHDT